MRADTFGNNLSGDVCHEVRNFYFFYCVLNGLEPYFEPLNEALAVETALKGIWSHIMRKVILDCIY